MKQEGKISSYCIIKNNKITLNGNTIFKEEDDDESFFKKVYKELQLNYPKFFKMDSLSRLAFIAADVLLSNEKVLPENEENIALVLGNRASSLDTDRKHQSTIQDKDNFYPSPAIFVYTLPNIMLGEISIKYKLYSENSFFVFDTFKTPYFYKYTNSLLNTEKADKVLCGWVNVDNDGYEAFLYLVTPHGELPHTEEQINLLYNKLWTL